MNKTPLLLTALTAFAPLAKGAEGIEQRPNILMICIDDLRQDGLSFGAPEAITPNLDKLSSQGRLFTHQYVQAPTSGASRSLMLTGRNAQKQRDVNNFTYSNSLIGSKEGTTPESFIHQLRREGYHTVGMGKVSHSDNGYMYPKNGFKVRELPYSWDEFLDIPNSPWPDTFDARLHGYENGRTRRRGVDPAFQFLDIPDTCYADRRLADLAIDKLDKLSKGEQTEPIFMAVGFYKPHLPFVAPKRFWDMYEDKKVSISPNPQSPQGVDNAFLHPSKECFGQYSHPEKGGIGVRLSDKYATSMRRAYLSAVTFTDEQVGRLLAKLEESGLAENTIVILWGDHGWHLGDQGIWGKHSGFERALNSPLIIKSPTMSKRGVASESLVAAIDIYPTICEYAGITPPQRVDGQSLVELVERGSSKSEREYVVSYWNNLLSIRNERYRLILFNNGKREVVTLFDHQKDPNESRNVASKSPKVVSELRAKLKEINKGYLPNLQ